MSQSYSGKVYISKGTDHIGISRPGSLNKRGTWIVEMCGVDQSKLLWCVSYWPYHSTLWWLHRPTKATWQRTFKFWLGVFSLTVNKLWTRLIYNVVLYKLLINVKLYLRSLIEASELFYFYIHILKILMLSHVQHFTMECVQFEICFRKHKIAKLANVLLSDWEIWPVMTHA